MEKGILKSFNKPFVKYTSTYKMKMTSYLRFALARKNCFKLFDELVCDMKIYANHESFGFENLSLSEYQEKLQCKLHAFALAATMLVKDENTREAIATNSSFDEIGVRKLFEYARQFVKLEEKDNKTSDDLGGLLITQDGILKEIRNC